jgi:hypothetical protein
MRISLGSCGSFVTVTKQRRTTEAADRCRWCGRPLPEAALTGRPRSYCRRACRQRDYEARQRARELGLSEDELVMTRAELDVLRDQLYVLEAAVEDVERDLMASPTKQDLRDAVAWIIEAARPLFRR